MKNRIRLYRNQRVIQLYQECRLTPTEIARIFEISVPTVYRIVAAGLKTSVSDLQKTLKTDITKEDF